jgi:CubicO group peptidase (beta-lactamase class C family)
MLIISATSCSEESPVMNENLTLSEKFQKALDDGIVKYGGKGISVAVIMPDGYTWKGASGISHGSVFVNTDMLFSAGSITKTFTAANIMLLAEEGKLSIDDLLHNWLPDFNNIDSTISLRQLLNHTCGIFDLVEHPDIWQEILFSNPGKTWEIEEMINTFTLEPYFPKGTNWHYSNTGYLLLRIIIREASGNQISSEYRNRFFNPFDLTSSCLYIEEPLQHNVAHGWFDLNDDNQYEDLTQIPMTAFYSGAGGGVFCTAEDLAKWAKALLKDEIVVSNNSLAQMLNYHSPCPGENLVDGYGLGVVDFNPSLFNGLRVIGHGGNAPGYAAASLYFPNIGVCIGIMDNTEEGDAMYIINDLLNIIGNNLN